MGRFMYNMLNIRLVKSGFEKVCRLSALEFFIRFAEIGGDHQMIYKKVKLR